MPAPIKVELVPHSPDWAQAAGREIDRLTGMLGGNLLAVHHIGSTAVPGIRAKPIVDLMPVVRSVRLLDEQAALFDRLGYQCWGEYGIVGRRYYTFDEPATGQRTFQLHCFEPGNPEVERHLAFRDYLRSDRRRAREYEGEKRRCQALYPDNSHAYSEAKSGWIIAELPAALAHFRDASGDRNE